MSVFTVTRRDATTDKAKRLRHHGVVPMAFVDREHETHLIKAPIDALRNALSTIDGRGIVEVQIEGEPEIYHAIVKSIDTDPIARQILSVTLQGVSDSDSVKTEIPVVAVGHSEDTERTDVVLTAVTTSLKIKAKVGSLPEVIEVNVSALHVGQHFSAGDVILPEGVELITPADSVLFSVSAVGKPQLGEERSEAADETAIPLATSQ